MQNKQTSANDASSRDYDVLIIGAGLAGLSLAALLDKRGLRSACIDMADPVSQLEESFDGRTTAISFGSRKVMEEAGIWGRLDPAAAPIREIQILDDESDVLLDFHSREVDGNSFGWILENRLIRQALIRQAGQVEGIDHIAPVQIEKLRLEKDAASVELEDGRCLVAPLIIGADGRNSMTRQAMGLESRGWSYNQQAIVCTVTHTNPHQDIAIEHFRPEGPFAVLPMCDDGDGAHRSSVVWTIHDRSRESPWPVKCDETSFNAALNARFPAWYGRVALHSKRFSYPLSLLHAHDYIATRSALVADAAHGIHPIAGQGLNLGLRDIAELADILADARDRDTDIGSDAVLRSYQSRRRMDNMLMAGATDSLNKLFSNDFLPIKFARQIGVRAVARLPFAKTFFMRQAMGAKGLLPDLIRNSA